MAIDNHPPSFADATSNGLIAGPYYVDSNNKITIDSSFEYADSDGYWNRTSSLLEDIIIIRQFDNSTPKIDAKDLWRAWTLPGHSMVASVDGLELTFVTTGFDTQFTESGNTVPTALPAISSTDKIYILRKTASKSKMVTFNASAKMTASSVNTAIDQTMQIGQELEAMWLNFTKIHPAYGAPGGVCPLNAEGKVAAAYGGSAFTWQGDINAYVSDEDVRVPELFTLDENGNTFTPHSRSAVNYGYLNDLALYGGSPSQAQSGLITVTDGGDFPAGTDQTYTLPFAAISTNTFGWHVSIDGINQVPDTDFQIPDSTHIKILGTTHVGDKIHVRNMGVAQNITAANATLQGDVTVTGGLTVGGNVSGNVSVVATGADVSRSLSDRFAEVINVKDYGAVGDGTTNDRAAIVAALADANTKWNANKGAVLYFPPGDYLYTTTSFSDRYLVLEADQTNANWTGRPSVMGCGNGSRLIGVGIKTNNSYTHISNLKLSGNRSTSPQYPAQAGIFIEEEPLPDQVGPHYISIHNCTIEDYEYGIFFDTCIGNGSARCRISDVLVRDCSEDGLWSADTRGVDVINSDFVNNNIGVNLLGAKSLKMTHCSIVDNKQYGIRCSPLGNERIYESYFVNCTMTGNGKDNTVSPTKNTITAVADVGGKAQITLEKPHQVPLNGYISTKVLRLGGVDRISTATNVKVLGITNEDTLTLETDYYAYSEGDYWQKIEWDFYADGGVEGNIYDLFFTNCNINTLSIGTVESLRFTNCRLLSNINMFEQCKGISFIGEWSTSQTADGTPLLPSGSAAGSGWSEISATLTNDKEEVHLRVPSYTPKADAGGTPTMFSGPTIGAHGELPTVLADEMPFENVPAGKTYWVKDTHVDAPETLNKEDWWVCTVFGNTPSTPSPRYIQALGYEKPADTDIAKFTGNIMLGSYEASFYNGAVKWTALTTVDKIPYSIEEKQYYRIDSSDENHTFVTTQLGNDQRLHEVPGGTWYFIRDTHVDSPSTDRGGDDADLGINSTHKWGEEHDFWLVFNYTGSYNATNNDWAKIRYPHFWGMKNGNEFTGASASCRIEEGTHSKWRVLNTVPKNTLSDGWVEASANEYTIASGVISLGTAIPSIITVDTEESDASGDGDASDELVTINNGNAGQRLIVKAEHGDRTVVVKDGDGNIHTAGGDCSLADENDLIELVYLTKTGHRVAADGWYELSRSINS